MKIRPHLTDDDLKRTSDQIVELQRADVALLTDYAEAFRELIDRAREEIGVPVVVLCNVETEEVFPSALDWEGMSNALQLETPIYRAAKRALERVQRDESVVLLYHPREDVLSIYTLLASTDDETGLPDSPVPENGPTDTKE